ncbi:MAG TPA: phosphate uptake regulator PhoU [Thermoplasmatales archaeon]|nr:phosphate uptake regulator PhoU [Thermoplasmatales archaeon]
MEIRKVQSTGGASYIITLPKKWVKSFNIKKNDTLGVIVQPNGALLITPKITGEQMEKTIRISVDGKSESYLFRLLVGAYIRGYSTIIVESKGKISPYIRNSVTTFTQIAIGSEVIEETLNSIIIKDLLNPAEMPFDKTIKRMHRLVTGMHEDSVAALRNEDKILVKNIVRRDDEVDRLHWLAGRQYNIISRDVQIAQKMGVTIDESLYYFLISRIIERIGDHAVKIAKNVLHLIEKKINDELKDAIASAVDFSIRILNESMNSWFKKDIDLANKNIEASTEAVPYCEEINSIALKKGEMLAIPISYIAESIRRTAEYAGDISELVINYLIDK